MISSEGNRKKLWEKPALLPFPPSRISHEITWDRLAFIRNHWYSTVEPVEMKKTTLIKPRKE
jgi:hypothetical protein